MYSANLEDQLFSEALPLKPIFPRCGSAETVTVAVPQVPALSAISIDTVIVELTLPDGSVVSADAVNKANTPLWSATFPASAFAVSGRVEHGLKVSICGKDELGVNRVWIVSKGDLEVKSDDAAPSPGGSYVIVKLRSSAPATPVDGDAYISAGALYIYQAGAWIEIGGNSGPNNSKLDGAAAYPAWSASHEGYELSYVVFHNGKLWSCAIEGTRSEPGVGLSLGWNTGPSVTIDALKANKSEMSVTPGTGANADKTTIQLKNGTSATVLTEHADPRYDLVSAEQTGEWQFGGDGVQAGVAYCIDTYSGASEGWYEHDLTVDNIAIDTVEDRVEHPTSLVFRSVGITATRAYALQDRSNNKILPLAAGSGTTYLQLPAAIPGKMRDFLVRAELATGYMAETNPNNEIKFVAPTSDETFGWESRDGEMPYPTEDGTYWFSFSESDQTVVNGAVTACKFAVSLEPLVTVPDPSAQGGS